LAAVLVYVGAKMLLVDVVKIPIWASLLVITAMIGASILVSLRVTAGRDDDLEPGDAEPEYEIESVR
jgi:tellurite resistance protein TerC